MLIELWNSLSWKAEVRSGGSGHPLKAPHCFAQKRTWVGFDPGGVQ